MTPQSPTESEWREWYRREYGLSGPELSPSTVSRTAYLAAASRRGALGDAAVTLADALLERTEARRNNADDFVDRLTNAECAYTDALERYTALSRARTPKPVDHLQEALEILSLTPETFISQTTRQALEHHITAALARGKEGK